MADTYIIMSRQRRRYDENINSIDWHSILQPENNKITWEHVQTSGNSKNENSNTQRRRDVIALTKRAGP